MIKILFSIILLLLSVLGFGQDFKERLSIDVCSCFEEVKDPSNYNQQMLLNCFSKNLPNYKEELAKQIDKSSELSEYEQGQILGRQLFFDIQKDLIHGCDAYYDFFQGIREATLSSMQSEADNSKIDSLDKVINETPTVELIFERGQQHFLSQNFDKAEKDFRKCLRKNPNHIQANYLLGWVLEEKGEYRKAIDLYEKVYAATNKQEMIPVIEIVKRKLNN